MPQVSLYVDNATMSSLRVGAEREGTSLSKYVVAQLRGRRSDDAPRCDTPSGLPEGYFERLYGCVDDDTFVRPSQLDYSLDAKRHGFE